MLILEAQKVLQEQGIKEFKEMRDVDGPGIGNTAIENYEERPDEGGILVHLYGYKYPYKGIPDMASVERFRIIKKVFLFLFLSIKNKPFVALVGILALLPRFLTKTIIGSVIDFFYSWVEWMLGGYLLKPNRYCTCCRELYRAFDVLIDREKESHIKKLLILARDFFVPFIEQDSAYKFRFQDIMGEVRVDKIRKGGLTMVKEIKRIITILKVRELFPVFAEYKWGTMEKLLLPALLVKEIRKYVHEFVKEVDFNKLKPDAGDWYYDLMRLDYDFGGKPLSVRLEEKKMIDGDNWIKYNYETEANMFLAEYKKYLGTRDFRLDIRDLKKQKEAVRQRLKMIEYIKK